MAAGFPTKANWVSGDILTAAAQDDLAGTVNLLSNASAASGTVLVSNVAGTSFAYQPLQAAGKNAVINGGMDIWQRGTSFSLAASTGVTYTADRFCTNTGANQATTISRQPTSDTTNLPNIQYALRYQRNSGQTGTTAYTLISPLETVNSIPYAGKQVTLSFYARAGANYSSTSNLLGVSVISSTGTDQNPFTAWTGSATPVTTTSALTTTWQRFQTTGTIATTATQLALQIQYTPTGTAGANDYFEVTGVQLELGSVATTFSRAGGTLQGELAACQRYLPVVSGASNEIIGFSSSTVATNINVKFPVTARVAPTGISIPTISGNFTAFNGSYATGTPTSMTFNVAGTDYAMITSVTTVGSPTLVAGQGGSIRLGASGYILFTGCEL